MTTENSGGGLPYFGVFSQKQVYTVYLDMRQTEVDTAPSWTLEFAVLEGSPTLAGAAKDPAQNQQGLVLPFPAVKPPPVLPAEIVRRHLRRMVIVYAVINIEGKMEQLSVKDSPDPLLNEPILAALRKWVFRPARLNGEPVSTIILLGIPLWISE
jgi:outer membrane biosynthesis protein TonB